MPPAPLAPELRAAAPALASVVATILLSLAALVARAFLRNPRRVALIIPLYTRLSRAARRFGRAMDRLAAATPSRPGGRGAGSRAPAIHLPASQGWLVAELRHEAAGFGSQLAFALNTPSAGALLAASPQATRVLRPICRMLGIRPSALPLSPRRARAAAMAGPAATPAATDRHAPIIAPPPPPAEPARAMPPPPCPHVGWPWFPHPAIRET